MVLYEPSYPGQEQPPIPPAPEKIKTPEALAGLYSKQAEQAVQELKTRYPEVSKKSVANKLLELHKKAEESQKRLNRALKAKARRPVEGLAEKLPKEQIAPIELQAIAKERMMSFDKIKKVIDEMETDKEEYLQKIFEDTQELYQSLPDQYSEDSKIDQKIQKLSDYLNRILKKHRAYQTIKLNEDQIMALDEIRDALSGDKDKIKEKLAPLFEEEEKIAA